MMTKEELLQRLNEIKAGGWIRTHRVHDTGIGKTLEDLLGIEENNIAMPDVGEIELKAKRAESGSMLTLATKSPLPRGVNKLLWETYGYLGEGGIRNLHCTVSGGSVNPQGFGLELSEDKLVLLNANGISAHWPISIFDDVLKNKSDKLLLVFAETRGARLTENEHFHFVEAHLLSGLTMERFRSAINAGVLKVDIRIGAFRSGTKRGQYHDHGTGFRIMKRDFLSLYESQEQLM